EREREREREREKDVKMKSAVLPALKISCQIFFFSCGQKIAAGINFYISLYISGLSQLLY
ncbi:MAG: hypothetical protein ACRC4N_07485, partial [Gammaproteobacteria bacterium]